MVAAFLCVEHRLDKMVGMKDLFGQDLTAMVKVGNCSVKSVIAASKRLCNFAARPIAH